MFKFNKLSNLKKLFERHITISAITENFIAFDAKQDAEKCFAYMEENHFDVIGVRQNGHIIGYARLSKKDKGLLYEHKASFKRDEILIENTPLTEAVHHLAKTPYIFVKTSNGVVGIVTRADLYKPAIRIWLYGLISILEIHMLELIRKTFPDGEWKTCLSGKRQRKMLNTYEDRRTHNEEIEKIYCTEFCDKRTIIEKSEVAFKATGFKSKAEFSENLKEIEMMRNEIAHSCKVSKTQWKIVSKLCKKIESLIDNIENFLSSGNLNRNNRR
jgi:hypothetical protein